MLDSMIELLLSSMFGDHVPARFQQTHAESAIMSQLSWPALRGGGGAGTGPHVPREDICIADMYANLSDANSGWELGSK